MSDNAMTSTGWIVFIAALGMMFSLIAVDISQLDHWAQATTPGFIGQIIGHLAAVIAAFVGGKLIPTDRDGRFTRATDRTIQLTSDTTPGKDHQ
jgi:hypothetical protein